MTERDALTTVADGDQLNQGYFNDILNIGSTIMIPLHSPEANTAGNWASNFASAMFYGIQFENGDTADQDNCTFKVALEKGTYSLKVLYREQTDGGIADFDIDGTEVASFDTYAGSNADNQINVTTSISVPATGLFDFKIRADGKNGSSSAYQITLHAVFIVRTV